MCDEENRRIQPFLDVVQEGEALAASLMTDVSESHVHGRRRQVNVNDESGHLHDASGDSGSVQRPQEPPLVT